MGAAAHKPASNETRPATGAGRPAYMAPAAALVATGVPVLGLAGLILLEGPANRPEADVRAADFIAYFGERDTVIAGGFLMMVSALCLIWFLGWLREALERDGDERLAMTAFGAGLVTAAAFLAVPAVSVLGAVYADELTPMGAKTRFLAGDACLYPASMAAAVLVAATALAALRGHALPRPFAWISHVLALWLLLPPVGGAGGTAENPAAWAGLTAFVAVPLWIALTGLLLAYRSADA